MKIAEAIFDDGDLTFEQKQFWSAVFGDLTVEEFNALTPGDIGIRVQTIKTLFGDIEVIERENL